MTLQARATKPEYASPTLSISTFMRRVVSFSVALLLALSIYPAYGFGKKKTEEPKDTGSTQTGVGGGPGGGNERGGVNDKTIEQNDRDEQGKSDPPPKQSEDNQKSPPPSK